ncbi:phage tail tube protein [Pseudochelatococcus sp. B33]
MALAKVFNFSGIRVLIGDGASPEVFGAPCGFTERAITFNKSLGESNIPDCDNEDAASWTGRDVIAKSASIRSAGLLDEDALSTWQGMVESDEPKNVRVELWRSGTKKGHWQAPFHLESFEPGGSQGQKVAVSVSLQSDGEVAWTAGGG